MDVSLLEDESRLANDIMEPRSSSECSPGFKITANMHLKKNLSEVFDREVTNISVMDHVAHYENRQPTRLGDGILSPRGMSTANSAPRPPLHGGPAPTSHENDDVLSSKKLSVYLRIRPPSSGRYHDKGTSSKQESGIFPSTIEILKPSNPCSFPTTIRTYPPSLSNAYKININRLGQDTTVFAKEFGFDRVLGPDTTQKTTYSAVAAPMVQDLLQSVLSPAPPDMSSKNLYAKSSSSPHALIRDESALLFSYGITNAGKTHTVLGDLNSSNQANWGLLPRAIVEVLEHINVLSSANKQNLYVSFFEIYNEQVYDLIPSKSTTKTFFGMDPALKVREYRGQTLVRGLARHRIKNIEHAIELTKTAHNKRHTSSNNLNKDSSRSHFVCQMQILPSKIEMTNNNAASVRHDDDALSMISMNGYSTDEETTVRLHQPRGTIWIVDLAGSERSKRTRVGSVRQKESMQINKSLMTLMRCLNTIKDHGKHGTTSNNVVPFRESKLSHIFMSHLTSRSAIRTAIMVNVNPAIDDFDETQHVLAYAKKAKLIEMKPEEYNRKRKEYRTEEYDINGRKKVKPGLKKQSPTQKAAKKPQNMLSRMAKKLSPKRILQNIPTSTRNDAQSAATTPSKGLNSSCRKNHTEQQDEETSFLKQSLEGAKAHIRSLTYENISLQEELDKKEDQIRTEVAIEMEEHLRDIRRRHQEKIEALRNEMRKQTSNSNISASIKNAESQLEELMDKVDECEREMVRMSRDHTTEVETLNAQIELLRNEVGLAKDRRDKDAAKIAKLEEKLAKKATPMQSVPNEVAKDQACDKGANDQECIFTESTKNVFGDENSEVEQLKFTLSVGKKQNYRRKLRPRKPLKNASNI